MLEFFRLDFMHWCVMSFIFHPWQLLLMILAGWANEQQQRIIEFQRTEIDVLKEKLGKRRILLTDDQRRRLAWSHSTCCLSWNWPADGFILPAVGPILTTFGWGRVPGT